MSAIRLQKFLASRGIASRRGSEELIRDGEVSVNGQVVTEMGVKVDPGKDEVRVRGRLVPRDAEAHRTIVLHKPRGYVCSRRKQFGKFELGSPTVFELLEGIDESLVPVGRLDKNSEGLLLLSNDGDLVQRLTHPSYNKSKTYRVTVSGPYDDSVLEQLNGPLDIEGGFRVQADEVTWMKDGEREGRQILQFVLSEGRKRQIRYMAEAVGLKVHRLVRTGVEGLTLEGLKPSQWRDLTAGELAQLGA